MLSLASLAGGAAFAEIVTTEPEIEIEDFAFRPATKVVRPRQVVIWKNSDRARHNATALKTVGGKPVFRTRPAGKGARLNARAPAARGTYRYLCSIHPRMRGRLVVR